MILVLTNSKDETVDYLCRRLNREGVGYIRIDTDSLTECCCLHWINGKAQMKLGSKTVDAREVKGIWLRRPNAPRLTGADSAVKRHAAYEWAEAIEGFLAHIPCNRWINHPSANAGASHKMEQLSRAQRFGFDIPRTIITQNPKTALRFWNGLKGDVVVKPLASGYIEELRQCDDSLIYTSKVGPAEIGRAHLIRKCPTLFQELVKKRSDVRVVYLDGQITAVELTAQDADGRCSVPRFSRELFPFGFVVKREGLARC